MGREINTDAVSRLDAQDAPRPMPDNLTLLLDAFAERQQQIGGVAVVLNAVLEIARGQGFMGTMDKAISLLRAAGFRVETGPDGRPIAWRNG